MDASNVHQASWKGKSDRRSCVTIGSFAIGNMKLDRFFVDLVLTGQTWEQM